MKQIMIEIDNYADRTAIILALTNAGLKVTTKNRFGSFA